MVITLGTVDEPKVPPTGLPTGEGLVPIVCFNKILQAATPHICFLMIVISYMTGSHRTDPTTLPLCSHCLTLISQGGTNNVMPQYHKQILA